MKGFKRTYDVNNQSEKQEPVRIRGMETNDRDGNFGLGTVPAQLMNWNMPYNQNSAKIIDVVADTYNDMVSWRPSFPFRSFLRSRNTVTGAVNPATTPLNLGNGNGAAAAGDVYVVTWVHTGDLNDNLEEVTFWMSRVGAAGNSPNSFIRVALFNITALANVENGELLAPGAGGVGAVPLNVDQLNYTAASLLAYAQLPFNDAPVNVVGAPLTFQLCYNAREDRTALPAALIPNQVYAIAIYLWRNAAETNVVHLHGTQLAADDPTSATYVGAAGWNGILAADNTVTSAYMELNRTGPCVVNKIALHADATQNLGDTHIAKAMVMHDNDDVVNNSPLAATDYNPIYLRDLIFNKKIGDQVESDIIFEGKAVIPRRYFLKLLLSTAYTGDLCIDVNYWANIEGNTVTTHKF